MPVMLCGNNGDGQLGCPRGQRDSRAEVDIPFVLPIPPQVARQKVVMAAAGSGHTVLLTNEGCVLSFGRGDDGRLGVGSQDWVTTPTMLERWESPGDNCKPVGQHAPKPRIVFVAAGSYHSAAVSDSGVLYTWGGGMFGKCGHGGERDAPCFIPRPVQLLSGRHIVSVACGSKHTVALLAPLGHTSICSLPEHSSAEVWSWGDSAHGVLGLGPGLTAPVRVPTRVDALQHAGCVAMSCCGSHILALTSGGEVYAWGEGRYGRLGLGHEEDVWAPVRVGGPLMDSRIVAVATGGCHSLALSIGGAVYAFGGGEHGQLGLGATANSVVPVRVKALDAYFVISIAAGWSHSLFLAEAGAGDATAAGAAIVLATGNGDHGKLGTGKKARLVVPERISAFTGLGVTAITSYNEHNVLLTAPDGPSHLPWDDESMVLGGHSLHLAGEARVRTMYTVQTMEGEGMDIDAPDRGACTGTSPAVSPLLIGRAGSGRGTQLLTPLPSAAGHAAYYSRGLDWARTRDRDSRDSTGTSRILTPRASQGGDGTPTGMGRLFVRTERERELDVTLGDGEGVGAGMDMPAGSPLALATAGAKRATPTASQGFASSPSNRAKVARLAQPAAVTGGLSDAVSLLHDLAWMVDNPSAFPDVAFEVCADEDEGDDGSESEGREDYRPLDAGAGSAPGTQRGWPQAGAPFPNTDSLSLATSPDSASVVSGETRKGLATAEAAPSPCRGSVTESAGKHAHRPVPRITRARPPSTVHVVGHRGLLTARCPAFAAIFAWARGSSGVDDSAGQTSFGAVTASLFPPSSPMLIVPLPDVSRASLLHLLHALYTDTLPARSARWTELSQGTHAAGLGDGLAPEEVVELAALADRFCAPERLLRLCERRLERGLTRDNSPSVLDVAHSYGAGAVTLKRLVLKYVARHFDSISTTHSFRQRIVPQADLMWEILRVRQASGLGDKAAA